MEQFLEGNVGTILLGIFGLIMSFFANKYSDKIKEIKEFLEVTNTALEDGKITPEEMQKIIKEAQDIIGK